MRRIPFSVPTGSADDVPFASRCRRSCSRLTLETPAGRVTYAATGREANGHSDPLPTPRPTPLKRRSRPLGRAHARWEEEGRDAHAGVSVREAPWKLHPTASSPSAVYRHMQQGRPALELDCPIRSNAQLSVGRPPELGISERSPAATGSEKGQSGRLHLQFHRPSHAACRWRSVCAAANRIDAHCLSPRRATFAPLRAISPPDGRLERRLPTTNVSTAWRRRRSGRCGDDAGMPVPHGRARLLFAGRGRSRRSFGSN